MQGQTKRPIHTVFEQGEKYFPCFKPRRGASPDLQPNAVQQRSKVSLKKERKNGSAEKEVAVAVSEGHGRSLGRIGETQHSIPAKAASKHEDPIAVHSVTTTYHALTKHQKAIHAVFSG